MIKKLNFILLTLFIFNNSFGINGILRNIKTELNPLESTPKEIIFSAKNNPFFRSSNKYSFIYLNPGDTLIITKDNPLIINEDNKLYITNSKNTENLSFGFATIIIEPDAKIILKKNSKLILNGLLIIGKIENFEFEYNSKLMHDKISLFISNEIDKNTNKKRLFFSKTKERSKFEEIKEYQPLKPKNSGLYSGCPQF